MEHGLTHDGSERLAQRAYHKRLPGCQASSFHRTDGEQERLEALKRAVSDCRIRSQHERRLQPEPQPRHPFIPNDRTRHAEERVILHLPLDLLGYRCSVRRTRIRNGAVCGLLRADFGRGTRRGDGG